MPFSLALSPEGNLIIDDWADEVFCFTKTHEAAAILACGNGNAAVLLWLAALSSTAELPAPALYWRDFAGHWLMAFCHRTGETPSDQKFTEVLETFPPMRGSEFLSIPLLRQLWADFGKHVDRQIANHPKGADGWLSETLPHWHVVGRVTLHLAENKRDAERPFAFLATYTSGLTPEGKSRHVLLQQAIKEYAGTKNRAGLLHLLEPVSLAAEKSIWLADQVASGAIYRQQAWQPGDALKFFKEIKVLVEGRDAATPKGKRDGRRQGFIIVRN
jgi:non-specific serine/threonine protein kinase